MNSTKYVYHMDGVSKTYPGGKKCFENIRLSFLPGVKIGVVGTNGSGKSTLMRIMAGLETEFSGVMCLHRCGHVLGKGVCLFLRARVKGKGVCHFVGACAASSSQDFRKINS